MLFLRRFPVREINIDSIQAPEPRTREEFLQCKSQGFMWDISHSQSLNVPELLHVFIKPSPSQTPSP